MKPICILHLTDTHTREATVDEIKRRVDAFIKYVSDEKINVDLIAITGDLAFSGTENEYKLFEEIFIEPIKRRLHINESKFLIIPGNHDVCREDIPHAELIKSRELNSSSEAEKLVFQSESHWRRMAKFFDYQARKNLSNPDYEDTVYEKGLFKTRCFKNINGISIGIAMFNTAWLCADDKDYQKLFLTEKQISTALEALESFDLKIALCHHPRDWMHPSERNLAINDLFREFTLVLTGHLHTPVSVHEITPSSNCLELTARAFHEGRREALVEDGFHFYELQIPEKKLHANYRKYIRLRNTFDLDTDHAQGGRHSFDLPLPITLQTNHALVVQRVTATSSILEEEIKRELSAIQGIENPILVTPKIQSVRFKNGQVRPINRNLNALDLEGRSFVLFGGKDCGKSIFLKTLAASKSSHNEKLLNVSFTSIETADWETIDSITDAVCLKLECRKTDLEHLKLRIVVDGFHEKPISRTKLVDEASKDHGWLFAISTTTDTVKVIATEDSFNDHLLVQILPWGPSRIREFAEKLLDGSGKNPDLAYKLVSQCLRTNDFPTTPSVICLYISLFSQIGEGISTLSFLRLIERVEQMKLGVEEVGTAYSLYNRQKVLSIIALECLDQRDIMIDRARAIEITDNYFTPKKLVVDNDRFIDFIVKSGILKAEGIQIGFSNFVYLDYYIAISFDNEPESVNKYLSDLHSCIKVAPALSLFAGLKRENIELARSVFRSIEVSCPKREGLSLLTLDRHINGLLLIEKRGIDKADIVAQESLEEEEDFEKIDNDYESQRRNSLETRKRLINQGVDESFDDVSKQISGLHAFYTIFRNLENLDGIDKKALLDKILDYHITTNFDLIDFYFQFTSDEEFRNIAAYMLTWTGHNFMAHSLGNPNLCSTIKELSNETENEFKKLLLLLLLSELRDPDSLSLIKHFVDETSSRVGTELMFLHLRNRLIEHDQKSIPKGLIDAFKHVFVIRQTKFVSNKTEGEAKNDFSREMTNINIEHQKNWKEQEEARTRKFNAKTKPNDGSVIEI